MDSSRSPKTVFSNSDLAQLEWVLQDVCASLEAQGGCIEDETKTYIRRRLFVLACNGMNDPLELRDHLVASFTRVSA